MRLIRVSIAAVLVGGSMLYVTLGEYKALGIIAGIAALIAARFIIPDLRSPRPEDESRDDQP